MKTTESGAIIRVIKNELNLTNKDIAETFGTAKDTVWKWSNGKNRATYDDIMMIIDHYELDFNSIRALAKHENTKL